MTTVANPPWPITPALVVQPGTEQAGYFVPNSRYLLERQLLGPLVYAIRQWLVGMTCQVPRFNWRMDAALQL